MYNVRLSSRAEKSLNKIPSQYQSLIYGSLIDLKDSPCDKKLVGEFKGIYSLRVGGFRIIYRIYKKDKNVFIIKIKHRKEVYR